KVVMLLGCMRNLDLTVACCASVQKQKGKRKKYDTYP
uniref:Uncharacterized protein n=1 Tax=Amphimedon queenslandica TaxID=400682 RepID=A0A1X7SHU2_AMPQE